MALDKVIKDHVLVIEELKVGVESDIDKMYELLDIDAIIAAPKVALGEFAEATETLILNKYAKPAADEGQEFGQELETEVIEFNKTKDPNLNEYETQPEFDKIEEE